MTAREPPSRHWRSYGTDPLPEPAEALQQPLAAFPSWFLRITCDRCGKDRFVSEVHTPQRDLPIRNILHRMRHDGCGGRAGNAELLTGIESASSRPVRKIVLMGAAALVVGLLLAAGSAWAETRITSRPGPFKGGDAHVTHCATRPGAFKGETVTTCR